MTLSRLRVSTNQRHFVAAASEPFFWLADTAWTLFTNLTLDEVDLYLANRRQKGFNVIQCVLLEPEAARGTPLANRSGHLPMHSFHPLQPNEAYFRHVDTVLDRLEKAGMYAALVPVWGELVVGWDWNGATHDRLIDECNAYDYGLYLGRRLGHRNNIVWILGGDRHPVDASGDYRPVWRLLAEGIGHGVTGQALSWNRPDPAWADLLMTYHTPYTEGPGPEIYSSSYWFHDDAWLSFNMLQSGHRAHVRSYSQIAADYQRVPHKPVLNGEPNYEDIVHFTVEGRAFFNDWDVRKHAYWSICAGACGYTYGHNSIWCMLDPEAGTAPGVLSWRGALDRPGAQQMIHLRNLFEQFPFWRTVPDQDLVTLAPSSEGSLSTRIQACRDVNGHFAVIYLAGGGTVSVNLDRLAGDIITCQWYDPRTGRWCDDHGAPIEEPYQTMSPQGWVRLHAPTQGVGNDWILTLVCVTH